MKIESGKYYKTRDGRKVGPAVHSGCDAEHPWNVEWDEGPYYYSDIGESCLGHFNDAIVSEWQDATSPAEPDLAALAAQHRIKITVQVGEVLSEYDGRE